VPLLKVDPKRAGIKAHTLPDASFGPYRIVGPE
jgi:hypothetical protein